MNASSIISGSKVLVVGDIILDKYIFGTVSRISPEAPVPVLRVSSEDIRLGGAANVANNIASLDCKCHIIGACGDDEYKTSIENMLFKMDIDSSLVHSQSTTTKIRIVGDRQQVVRVDYEEPIIPTDDFLIQVINHLGNIVSSYPVIVLSDYGKGVISEKISKDIIELANKAGKITIVDPKGAKWAKYANATIVTPNVKELGEAIGYSVKNTDLDVVEAGKKLREKYNLKYLVVTRSEKGMTLISESEVKHFHTHAQEVFDVSGAGDTVVATMACALSSGANIYDSLLLANMAAGIVIAKPGTAVITYSELIHASHKQVNSIAVSSSVATEVSKSAKKDGKRVVFTNGCFDVLHRGHADYLKKARALGDILIVGLNSDSSVRLLKGEDRPLNNQEDRAFLLSCLSFVDYVVIFYDETPLNLIREIQPDFLVKGGDYSVNEVVGREYAKEVVIIDFVKGYSTTSTLDKMKALEDK